MNDNRSTVTVADKLGVQHSTIDDNVSSISALPDVFEFLRLLKDYPALEGMLLIQSLDSFQGKEGTLTFVILGTKEGQSAGFVSDPNHLNVMITWQKSGLVIVGDINVTGKLSGGKKDL